MYESPNLQPPDDKEVKYTECEFCEGDGWIYNNWWSDTLLDTHKIDCPKCHGSGQIEIED
ncbi:MAG: hypothetical protein V4538_15500 [Bacteroidota bacterium]